MSARKQYRRTGNNRPKRNLFDNSVAFKGTCRMGELIPIMCDEVSPGDTLKIANELLIRFQPLVKPVMHEVSVCTHYFYVPYRLLWNHWEKFITGGNNGKDNSSLPLWPVVTQLRHRDGVISAPFPLDGNHRSIYSLWDYFSFPFYNTNVPPNDDNLPLAFPLRAYNLVFDEYFRDENTQALTSLSDVSDDYATIQETVPGTADLGSFYDGSNVIFNDLPMSIAGNISFMSSTGFGIPGSVTSPAPGGTIMLVSHFPRRRNWTKDYFTSALPFQQRGDPPALSLHGTVPVIFDNPSGSPNDVGRSWVDDAGAQPRTEVQVTPTTGTQAILNTVVPIGGVAQLKLGPASANLDDAITFNISDLRYTVAVQRWMELNARAGVRYTEFLKAHYGVSPRDDRMQRPEYIGGTKNSMIISEVLQTSGTPPNNAPGTPQANMAGHGLSAQEGYVGTYKAYEFGLIIGLMSIMPRLQYEDGINRQWLRRTRYDFYAPEFVHLSEQGIFNNEVYVQGAITPIGRDVWGFQSQYDELRIKYDRTVSEMRVKVPAGQASLADWHLGRDFSTLPNLGPTFFMCVPSLRIFAYRGANDYFGQARPCLYTVNNIVKAYRPLPLIGEPGLLDHTYGG